MPTSLLIGEDTYSIQQKLAVFKSKLDSTWLTFNLHTYAPEALAEAITTARTPPLADTKRVVIVENCQFNQFGEQQLEILQILPNLPINTTLIFTAKTIDKRLKVAKHLLKYGKLHEFEIIPPWRTDLIEAAIAHRAKQQKLALAQPVVAHLANAIGNNLARMDSELTKLKAYANSQPPSLAEVKRLISSTTHSSLQLAEAMRKGDVALAMQLLHELRSRAEIPLVILSTLLTQFRTWLWVKCALSDQTRRKDAEIAQLCGVGNPKRLYYLRQEVAKTSVRALIQAVTWLFDLEGDLKQGGNSDVIMPALVGIARLFKS
ncbi:MAG: DNA polymerase III subunit delta [Leptolyngbyaceae cyanobacterium bins.302]|nr:DNA polymerase III subunit delta [Leptolyngbyaceae cyanobacterium bins.302]